MGLNMSKIINAYSLVLNFNSNHEDIQSTLDRYSRNGFKLVSTEVSNGDYVNTLYLFFTKEVDE